MGGLGINRALIIIDVQKGMFTFGDPHNASQVIEALQTVLSKARGAGAPIFFVQHEGGKGRPLARNGDGFAFHDALTPQPSEPVTVKRHCSVFQGTDFERTLRDRDVGELVIGGMQTELCVDTAVRGAFERGFSITLLADGHTTFDTPDLPAERIIAHHNHTLSAGDFARVQNSADIGFG